MASITFAVDKELKSEIAKFLWVNWSELLRRRLLEREILKQQLLKKFKSKEEQEIIRWSVELGRKAKKGRFKELLSELPPKRKEELLGKISYKKEENN